MPGGYSEGASGSARTCADCVSRYRADRRARDTTSSPLSLAPFAQASAQPFALSPYPYPPPLHSPRAPLAAASLFTPAPGLPRRPVYISLPSLRHPAPSRSPAARSPSPRPRSPTPGTGDDAGARGGSRGGGGLLHVFPHSFPLSRSLPRPTTLLTSHPRPPLIIVTTSLPSARARSGNPQSSARAPSSGRPSPLYPALRPPRFQRRG